MNKRCALYGRVSSDPQRENYSVPSQVEAMEAYALQQEYSIVGNMHVDRVTGKDARPGDGSIQAYVDDFTSRELSRPALDQALAYLENEGYDVLVVHAIDRLARDPFIRQALEREFLLRGAKVEFVLGNYEDSAEGEIRKDLDATFAKWENAKRVERSLRGKRRKAQSGKFVAGRAPYGYRVDKEAPGGLAVEPHEAEVVRRIFDLYGAQGHSLYQVVAELNAMADAVPYRGGAWGKTSVAHLLENENYIGVGYYNKFKRIGRQLIKRDPSEWIRYEVTPLIELDLFNLVKQRRELNRAIRRRTAKRSYLLTGRIRCEECQHGYVTQTSLAGRGNKRKTDAPAYRHRIKNRHCMNRSISARKLDSLVWNAIKTLLMDPERLRVGYFASLEQQQATQARQRLHLEELRRGLVKQEQRKQNLTRLYTDPDVDLTKAEYLAQRHEVEDQIAATLADIGRLEEDLAVLPTPAEFETLEKFSAEIRARLDQPGWEPTQADMREILDLLHVIVWIAMDGSWKLAGWFESGKEGLSSTSLQHYAFQLPRLPTSA